MTRARGASIIVVYHRVAMLARDPQHLAVDPDRFAEQLRALRRVADVVPLAATLEPHRDRRVAVTFDDGYADNARIALPVLRSTVTAATVFVTTDVLRGGELWWDRLEHLTLDAVAPTGRIVVDVAGQRLEVDVRSGEGRARANRALSRRLRLQTPDEIVAVLDQVRDQVAADDAPCDTHAVLSETELRGLAAEPLVDIGAHSRCHANLGRLDVDRQRAEIEGSRDDLRAVLGHAPAAFAYPFGMAGSFDRRTERIVRDAGFSMACANVPGPVRARDRFRLPRHIVGDWTGDEVAARAVRWLDGETG